MQIQLGEGVSVACGEAALSGATHDTGHSESCWRRKSIAKVVAGEAARRDLLGRESERYGARRGTQSFRVAESGFMPQI